MLDALLPIPFVEDLPSDRCMKRPKLGIGPNVLECYFLTALYCSLGASLVEESQVKFDSYIKKLAAKTDVPGEGAVAGPEEMPIHYPTLYEYFFDSEKQCWVPWADKVPEYEHVAGKKFHEILVPTVDTVRNTWLLQQILSIKKPVVLVGETGTSKTATTQNFLRQLDPDFTVSVIMNFLTMCINMNFIFILVVADNKLFFKNYFNGCTKKS